MPGRRKSGKNAPIFSHEFIITNHGDIVSCVCMVFMIGLMFQVTSKVAAVFIAPQHNVTREINVTDGVDVVTTYTNGPKDFCTIFFYSLAWIVVHAIIQEYILDKVIRKLHLSKTKNSKFNDSGELLPFYFASAAWGADIIMKEKFFPSITNLWDGYPHNEMSFVLKFYFILQIAHWVHCFPELYFMKARKEEISAKIQLYVQYLFFIWAAYMLNFTHLAICCLTIHYSVEFVYHAMRLLQISGKAEMAKNVFMVWSGMFVLARLAIIALTVMTFWYGLPRLENAALNVDIGNFNTPFIRVTAMAGVILVQAWLAWNFIKYQIRLWREYSAASSPKKREQRKKVKKETPKKKVEDQNEDESEEELSEEKNGGMKLRNKRETKKIQ
ncbi:translocating chain-associated membrane protein 1 [Exaiptasia diaphana]|uniref:TLC domain-containing protein n=1 Tax=Exaiptasia diaphana TaxID=2652724 RepID=A0A913WYS6_EXADI|nr:translocating chain-associated membrane protein 1 [Exaiptasia diaphana]KXJ16752.1 Translocating chain-associated membrane protein 1-like 1 [Exaiptasia diaphana]